MAQVPDRVQPAIDYLNHQQQEHHIKFNWVSLSGDRGRLELSVPQAISDTFNEGRYKQNN